MTGVKTRQFCSAQEATAEEESFLQAKHLPPAFPGESFSHLQCHRMYHAGPSTPARSSVPEKESLPLASAQDDGV